MATTEAISFSKLHRYGEQGDAGAQFNLGILYEHGPCVTQDFQEAAKWYRMAAEQGHAALGYKPPAPAIQRRVRPPCVVFLRR